MVLPLMPLMNSRAFLALGCDDSLESALTSAQLNGKPQPRWRNNCPQVAVFLDLLRKKFYLPRAASPRRRAVFLVRARQMCPCGACRPGHRAGGARRGIAATTCPVRAYCDAFYNQGDAAGPTCLSGCRAGADWAAGRPREKTGDCDLRQSREKNFTAREKIEYLGLTDQPYAVECRSIGVGSKQESR
jgi:hypothetical protein